MRSEAHKKEQSAGPDSGGGVRHERQKVRTSKPDHFLNQKKQLWYGVMNWIDEAPNPDSPPDGQLPGEER